MFFRLTAESLHELAFDIAKANHFDVSFIVPTKKLEKTG